MTHDPLSLIVRMAHIVTAVLWVGGAVYAGFIVGRSLMSQPPQVRGPAMGAIGPRGYKFLTWMGVLTIVFGVWNGMLIGGNDLGGVSDLWRNLMGASLVIAVVMMGLAGAIIGPSLKKMAAGPAPDQAAAIQKRLMMTSMANIALGVLAVILMVWATSARAG